MNRALVIAVFAVVLVLPATAPKGGAQKSGGGLTTSNIPIVNSLSPSSQEAGMGSFVLTVTGSNFTTGSSVRWNGSGVSTGYVSSTQLYATISSSLIANTGTANVTVYTSGRKGGTSNTVTFTITTPTTTTTPTSSPPPPSPTPLSITTTSLPGGTANSSFNANVAATGGAPAYGWSLVNNGGSLPPGLALQANGTISGTPTQSGTFTFTTQASDQASQMAQKVLSITVAADPNATTTTTTTSTSGGYLFSDDFESGNFSAWSSVVNPPPFARGETTITSAAGTVSKGTYAAKMTFIDSTQPTVLTDIDRYLSKNFPANYIPDHFFLRTYVKLHINAGGAGLSGIQRKLIYINATLGTWRMTFGTDPDGLYWYLIHDAAGGGSRTECDTRTNRTNVVIYPDSVGTEDTVAYNVALDQWYYIELEVQLNSPGNADGYENVWVQAIGVDPNPILVIQTHNVNIRHSLTNSIDRLDLGEQANWANFVINEERYHDNFAISGNRINP